MCWFAGRRCGRYPLTPDKGLFVSMPQETFTGKDGQKKYSNTFFALTNSAKLELQESVLQAYQQQMDPNYVAAFISSIHR